MERGQCEMLQSRKMRLAVTWMVPSDLWVADDAASGSVVECGTFESLDPPQSDQMSFRISP